MNVFSWERVGREEGSRRAGEGGKRGGGKRGGRGSVSILSCFIVLYHFLKEKVKPTIL